MTKNRKRHPTRKNGIARALGTPRYRQRVKPNKNKK